jgi:hypothetical protein
MEAEPARATAPGIPQTTDVASSCTITSAPARASAAAPSAPSRPMPLRTIPTPFAPNDDATLANMGSTDGKLWFATSSECSLSVIFVPRLSHIR